MMGVKAMGTASRPFQNTTPRRAVGEREKGGEVIKSRAREEPRLRLAGLDAPLVGTGGISRSRSARKPSPRL